MKPSLVKKLQTLTEHHQNLATLLSDPDVIHHQSRYRALSKEYAQLEPLVLCFRTWQSQQQAIEQAKTMLDDEDEQWRVLAHEELATLEPQQGQLETKMQLLLLPQDPNDERNVFLEVRAGSGGDEAALFAGDLLKMYLRYAEQKHWQREIISQNEGEHGGFKEVIVRVVGARVFSQLKFESGTHRVQRVPTTESQGRIHTSACTVAIMPEVDEVDAIEISPSDLRIDTFRASGSGGQHVNKTDSAIRITHIPTGVVVECQDERSQHKNKARAMGLLQSRLLMAEQAKQHQQQAAQRKSLIGSGDRSERIRTYNFPQGRVTDHRIHLTLYQLDEILSGELDILIQPLHHELQAEQLASMADDLL